METVLFGGAPVRRNVPASKRRDMELDDTRGGPTTIACTHMYRQSWPFFSGAKDLGGEFPYTNFVSEHVPAWWTSAMVSEKYWQDTVARSLSKDGYIRPHAAFKQDTFIGDGITPQYPMRLIAEHEYAAEGGPARDMQPDRTVINQRWESENERMSTLRPWYDEEFHWWKMTPCAFLRFRPFALEND